MAWVKDGRYYQTSKRVNGRVVSTHLGGGDRGLFFFLLDEEAREEEREVRRQHNEIEDEQRKAYETEVQRGEAINTLVAIGLEALGFVRYARGRWWRRKDMKAIDNKKPDGNKKLDKSPARKEIRSLIEAVVRGDRLKLPRLAEIARTNPIEFTREIVCHMPEIAKFQLAKNMFPAKEENLDNVWAQMHLVSAELSGDNPSPARRLCAEFASFAWAEAWSMNFQAAASGITRSSLVISQRQTAAANRLLRSLRTLAQIERCEATPRRRRVLDATYVETTHTSLPTLN
jgi:hypothetical protein